MTLLPPGTKPLALILISISFLIWSGLALLFRVPTARLDVTYKSIEPARINIRLKGSSKETEKLSAETPGLTLRQTMSLECQTPDIRSLSVKLKTRLKNSSSEAPSLLGVKLFNANGQMVWEGQASQTDWTFKPGLSLPRPWYLSRSAFWLSLALGLVVAMAAWRVSRSDLTSLPWQSLKNGAFATFLILGFSGSAFAYWAALENQRGAPLPSESWVNDISIEKATLSQTFPSPRTFVTGGSSGLYGVDCQWLSENAGHPVINLATHAAMPLSFHLNRVLQLAKPGDQIILHLEYAYWSWLHDGDWEFEQSMTWAWDVEARKSFSFSPWMMVTHVSPQRILAGNLAKLYREDFRRPKAVKVEVPALNASDTWWGAVQININSYGDINLDSYDNRPLLQSRRYVNGPFEPEKSPDAFNHFITQAKRQGIAVFIAFPASIQSPQFDFRDSVSVQWTNGLTFWAKARGLKVLGRPEDTQLPINQFFDTTYHLMPEGRLTHSKTLLKLLQKEGWLGKSLPQNQNLTK